MGTEQLYFIIGFLLGAMLSGCLSVLGFIVWYEWFYKDKEKIGEKNDNTSIPKSN